MSTTPHRKNVNAPRLMTSRIGNFDFALVEGLWCSWCGTDIRAIDVEPIDDDGGLRLCCRDCGQLILRQERRP
jgi:hypothetical protein